MIIIYNLFMSIKLLSYQFKSSLITGFVFAERFFLIKGTKNLLSFFHHSVFGERCSPFNWFIIFT